MRTIRTATISMVALIAAGAPAPAAGQDGRGTYILGSLSKAATPRPGTTAGTATPTRPATMPQGILKTQPPRWSMETNRPKHVRVSPGGPQVRMIPNENKGRPVHPRPAASRPSASAPRPVQAAPAARPVQPRHSALRGTAQTASRTAAASTGKALLRGGAMGAVGAAVVGVGLQELNDPGRTMRDIKSGNINWTDVSATGASVGVGAVAGAAGVTAAPVLVLGAGAYGAVKIAEQERRHPGKTAADIKAATGIDLKKAGSDINRFFGIK
jgi:hypothetical protein